MIARLVLIWLAALVVAPAAALPTTPAPGFVVEVAAPAPRPARARAIEDGVESLLEDTQVRAGRAGETTYRRRVQRVVERGGLEGVAKIEIGYDPSYERLRIHHLRLRRGDRIIDLAPAATIDVIRQESDLADGILTGRLTAVVQLRDVRVGDVVDTAWSWDGAAPLLRGRYAGLFDLGWSVPVGLTRVRVLMADGLSARVGLRNGAPAPVVRAAQGGRSYEWRIVDPDLIPEEDGTPDGAGPWPSAELSTTAAWRDVVAWALPLYAPDPALPPEFAARIDRIAAATRDPRRRATRALRLVQDGIRYTSLSIGPGSYRPRPPAEVVRSGFGDCKDKALLLSIVLRRLGIAAWPALTDIDQGPDLARRLPSPGAFDHVVVVAAIGGATHWLDPTQSNQGGAIPDLAALPYGHALPIRAGQARLEAIPFPPDAAPTIRTIEHIRRTPAGIDFAIATTFLRDEADTLRARLASRSPAKVERERFDYIAEDYPGLEPVGGLAVRDDREANRIRLVERYRLPATALTGELLKAFPIYPAPILSMYAVPKPGARRTPLGLPFPLARAVTVVLDTPGFRPSSIEDATVDGAGFRYTIRSHRGGDRLTIDFALAGKRRLLEPGEVAAHRRDAKRLDDIDYWTIDLTRTDGEAWIEKALIAAMILAALALAVWAVVHARRRDAAMPEGVVGYPVPLWKLALLSLATFGGYTTYWQWRAWRQVCRREGEEGWPLARAIFTVFWIDALFRRLNDHAHPPLARGWGIVATVLTLAAALIAQVGNHVSGVTTAVTTAGWLLLLAASIAPPALSAVRANPPGRTRRNARLGAPGVAALLAGIVVIAALVEQAS